MINIQNIPAFEDWPRYIDIYNRHMKYAPYSLPLSMELLQNHVLNTYDENCQLCLIGKHPRGEGIIHAGLYQNKDQDEGKEIGLIYLLLGDDNNIAEHLLRTAEGWFACKGLRLVRACNYRPNPYKFILHGLETYVWGGSVTAINAFRRLQYDLSGESVIMICKIENEPEIAEPDITGLIFTLEKLSENNLFSQGIIRAHVDETRAGECSFYHLKAISDHFGKQIGQIAIGIQSSYFGKGLGQALLLKAHQELFRMGVRQVMLHTTQSLFRAIKLYEKVGYTVQNIRGYIFEKELFK